MDLKYMLYQLKYDSGHLAERHLREARHLVRQRVGLLEPLGGPGRLHEVDRWLSAWRDAQYLVSQAHRTGQLSRCVCMAAVWHRRCIALCLLSSARYGRQLVQLGPRWTTEMLDQKKK